MQVRGIESAPVGTKRHAARLGGARVERHQAGQRPQLLGDEWLEAGCRGGEAVERVRGRHGVNYSVMRVMAAPPG